jgi:hypothetical protein
MRREICATSRLLRKLFPGAVFASCFSFLAGCGESQLKLPSRAQIRAPIDLSVKEQEHLRFEMRRLLESIGRITGALAENKMDLVAENAKQSGMGMVDGAAISIAMNTTPEFVALSADMHQKLDDLALYATAGGTKTGALKQLGAILTDCTACHAAYRIGPK